MNKVYDDVGPPSLFELLDLRRVPFRATVHELTSQFPIEQEQGRFKTTRCVLRGLEPLVLAMTEPLHFSRLKARVDLPPPSFYSSVDTFDTPMENFEAARSGFADIFGPGAAYDYSYDQDKTIGWRWDLWPGEITLRATVKMARPSSERYRNFLSRTLNPAPRDPPPVTCDVAITPNWVPELSPIERRAIEEFVPFDFVTETDDYGIVFGMRRRPAHLSLRRGVGLTPDGSMLVDTRRERGVVVLPVDLLLGVTVYNSWHDRAASTSDVSLAVQHPNGVGGIGIHGMVGAEQLGDYGARLGEILGLEVTERTINR